MSYLNRTEFCFIEAGLLLFFYSFQMKDTIFVIILLQVCVCITVAYLQNFWCFVHSCSNFVIVFGTNKFRESFFSVCSVCVACVGSAA